MSKITAKLGLVCQEGDEKYDVKVVNENMTKIDAALGKMDQDQTNLRQNVDNFNLKIDNILEKGGLTFDSSASGVDIHLTDSTDNNIKAFALYGKATQNGTPTPDTLIEINVAGKSYNLLENTATSQTVNGVEFTANDDDSITVNGTASALIVVTVGAIKLKANQKYLLSGGASANARLDLRVSAGMYTDCTSARANNEVLSFNTSDTWFIPNSDTTVYVILRIESGATINKATLYPMIRKASVQSNRYMPYGVGSVEVKSVGKNLLKNAAITQTVNGVTFTVNDNGTVTAVGTAVADVYYNFFTNKTIGTLKSGYIYLVSGGTNSCQFFVYNVTQSKGYGKYYNGITEMTANDSDLFNVGIKVPKDSVVNDVICPMIRLASDPDDTYEPYKEIVSTIPTTDGLVGIPIDSDGNYTDENGQQWICDEIVKYADGSGKRIQRIEKLILDGDENFAVNEELTDVVKIQYYLSNEGIGTTVPSYCDRLINKYNSNNYEHFYTGIASAFLFLNKNRLDSIDKSGVQAFFSANNAIIYYVLAEPIITDLTAEEIAEIEKLQTFYPVTNISNDADCGMQIAYKADAKNYIDNQLTLQMQAQEASLMNVLLLMPEETQAAMIENDTNNLLSESEV